MGHLGFSYLGLVYMLMIEVPNILWAKNKPQGYDPDREKTWLLVFERCGQVLCTTVILFFSDTNPTDFSVWVVWLLASLILMLLYEAYWLRYFRGEHTLVDFYSPFFKIPLPGATLPVIAFLLLGIYGRLLWLVLAAVILGIGHIGIHIQHFRQLKQRAD